MKTLLQIGLILTLFSLITSSKNAYAQIHIAKEDPWSSTQSIVLIESSTTDFRRNLIEFLSLQYQSALKEYYVFWQDSGQSINRYLIDEILKITTTNTQTNTISLTKTAYDMLILKEKIASFTKAEELYNRYHETDDILYLVQAIEIYLSVPNEIVYDKIQEFINYLKNINIEYHNNFLVYNQNNIIINLMAPAGTIINFSYNLQNIEISSNKQNIIPLSIGFNHQADINIITNSDINQSFVVNYNVNIEKSFRTTRFMHYLVINYIIANFLGNTKGDINILYINDAKFWIQSDNFGLGVQFTTDILKRKGWKIGDEFDYNNIIVINKTILDERRLNIGTYYAKAYLEISFYNNYSELLQYFRTTDIEAVDNVSIQNCHSRIDNKLLQEINKYYLDKNSL